MKKAPALLLIDIQNDYFPGGLNALEGMDAAADNARRVLAEFRRRDWPRFHVQHVSTRAGATFFLPGTPGVEIHESVCPAEDEPRVEREMLLPCQLLAKRVQYASRLEHRAEADVVPENLRGVRRCAGDVQRPARGAPPADDGVLRVPVTILEADRRVSTFGSRHEGLARDGLRIAG